ncbi:CAP domain-containing protein [Streptomyces sp. NPDC056462]|uniref:CAP domain-containing protein n=1 Tax=Streptomyces sp. NPDC056462 TaxID=3345826 RepID=UPI0036CD81B6
MPVSRYLATILVGTIASTALLTTSASAAPATGAAAASATSMQKAVVQLTNAARRTAGCPALKIKPALHKAAQRHSADMAKHNYVGHIGSHGSTIVDRVEASGYTGWSALAENVAAVHVTAAGVVKSWMNSPGHRANILNCSLEHVGVGYVKQAGSAHGTYWTQNFGAKL